MADNAAVADKRAGLEQKAKRWLYADYKAEKITYMDVAAYVWLLTELDNAEQVEFVLNLLSEQFPTLAKLTEQEQFMAKEEFEYGVKDVVALMLKDDPMSAASVAKTAMAPGMTVEKLVTTHPEVQPYLDKLNQAN